jgi:hypothetical protein
MALPTGDGNFILIVFYSYAWYRTIETGYWSAIKILAEDGSTLGGFTYPPDQMSESDTSYIIGNPTMQPDNGRISFEVQSGSGRSVSVFACNNSTIRPIDLPATMEAIVSELLPAPSSATLTTDFRGLTQSYTIPTVSSSFFGPAVYGNCGGYSNDGWGNVYSPEIYGILNDSAGFVNAGQIKTFPTSQRWGLMDASSGGYQKFQTGSPSYPWWSDCYRDGDPLKHALWKNANEEPCAYWILPTAIWSCPPPQRFPLPPSRLVALDPRGRGR